MKQAVSHQPTTQLTTWSAIGAKELSPALQRWVGRANKRSAVGTTDRISSAVPTGLLIIHHIYPVLKPWAKLFRPASGARVLPFEARCEISQLSKSEKRKTKLMKTIQRTLSIIKPDAFEKGAAGD